MEGYVLHTYGKEDYLRHAVASVLTLRRYDTSRPVALYADEEQIALLKSLRLDSLFSVLEVLPESHRSIVGFKHHLEKFKPFERSLFVDSDIVWCRDPDPLWTKLKAYKFTATGLHKADFWFGGPKGFANLWDRLLDRRRRTIRRFGLTYLPRVQAGMIYAADDTRTSDVMTAARDFLSRSADTHFRSRLDEGRSEESCEWSLAMGMSYLDLPVFDWFQGQDSPQLDFIEGFVEHDEDFKQVRCRHYADEFVHGLRGLPGHSVRDALVRLFSSFPGRGDFMWVTPHALHFGWMHHKQPFYDLSDRLWDLALKNELAGGDGEQEDVSLSLTSDS
ncbi:MAG: hypothetical protein O2797_01015 [Bacteroidetes bacterium]|nr:hypothetical protein [Bacteroidota bacterium]MDA1332779.1 hypothetical protein [Bacteroidota bacterium]